MTTAYSMEEEHEHTVVVREKLNDFFIVFFLYFFVYLVVRETSLT